VIAVSLLQAEVCAVAVATPPVASRPNFYFILFPIVLFSPGTHLPLGDRIETQGGFWVRAGSSP